MNKTKLWTYLAPSTVCDGVGVFALVEIPRDTLIFESDKTRDRKVPWSEVCPSAHAKLSSLTYCDDEGFEVDCDINRIDAAYYVNHSYQPNVRYDKQYGNLYAIKDILPGEELLDYYTPLDRDF